MAAKDGTGPRPATHRAKRCFLNCLETRASTLAFSCHHLGSKDPFAGLKHHGSEGRIRPATSTRPSYSLLPHPSSGFLFYPLLPLPRTALRLLLVVASLTRSPYCRQGSADFRGKKHQNTMVLSMFRRFFPISKPLFLVQQTCRPADLLRWPLHARCGSVTRRFRAKHRGRVPGGSSPLTRNDPLTRLRDWMAIEFLADLPVKLGISHGFLGMFFGEASFKVSFLGRNLDKTTLHDLHPPTNSQFDPESWASSSGHYSSNLQTMAGSMLLWEGK